MIVLDASLVIAHVLGESTIAVDRNIFDLVQADKIIAPAHWSVEIANALTSNIRRKRLAPKTAALILDQIAAYDIELVDPPSIRDLSGLLLFADQHQLTAYDAAYVMLAADRHARLATLDNAMRHAASRLQIELAPPG